MTPVEVLGDVGVCRRTFWVYIANPLGFGHVCAIVVDSVVPTVGHVAENQRNAGIGLGLRDLQFPIGQSPFEGLLVQRCILNQAETRSQEAQEAGFVVLELLAEVREVPGELIEKEFRNECAELLFVEPFLLLHGQEVVRKGVLRTAAQDALDVRANSTSPVWWDRDVVARGGETGFLTANFGAVADTSAVEEHDETVSRGVIVNNGHRLVLAGLVVELGIDPIFLAPSNDRLLNAGLTDTRKTNERMAVAVLDFLNCPSLELCVVGTLQETAKEAAKAGANIIATKSAAKKSTTRAHANMSKVGKSKKQGGN